MSGKGTLAVTTFFAKRDSVVMGPDFRQDDIEVAAPSNQILTKR
jgi:hypothetical protein